METKDKDLLLKDLCARLPYGVICHYDTIVPMVGKVKSYGRLYNISFFDVKPCFQFHCNRDVFDFDNVKPYLFPLSSMTEEQKRELLDLTGYEARCEESYGFDFWGFYVNIVGEYTYKDGKQSVILYPDDIGIDWLNAHYFDYRGLIEKGLAIDATGLNIY